MTHRICTDFSQRLRPVCASPETRAGQSSNQSGPNTKPSGQAVIQCGGSRSMRRRNVIINAGLGGAVVAIALVSYFTVGSSAKASAAARTTTVRSGTITASVSASGNATSATTTAVSFTDCTGKLIAVDAHDGQVVKA